MPKIKLTKEAIDKAVHGRAPLLLWDAGLPGFGVKIAASGAKTFVVQMRVKGRSVRAKLGNVGVMTLDQARERARASMVGGADGVDPIEAKRESSRKGLTVGALFEQWIDRHIKPKRSERTAHDYEAVWRRYLEAPFAHRIAAEVKRADVMEVHHKLRDTPKSANYAVIVLKALFNYAIKHEMLGDSVRNPTSGMELFEQDSREVFLTLDEVQRIGEALAQLVAEGRVRQVSAIALTLCLVTGARSGAIKSLRWSEVDLPNRQLAFKVKRKHLKMLPLNDTAVRILEIVPRTADSAFVIPGRIHDRHLTSLQVPWNRVKERANIDESERSVRIHDLRHTFASLAIASGATLHAVSKLLGHTTTAMTQKYAHLSRDAISDANNIAGSHIGARLALAQSAPKPELAPSQVLPAIEA